ncbi:hypothetical protein K474DRAFT_1663891 [Panus rudis PR-1116 ss-1]|nr:hypothetical protein K474DRAFT_1663891 [Panus rudis PR-1116 ss-1]
MEGASGTVGYFQSAVARIRESHPDIPLEPVILQALLLCLVAGNSSASSTTEPSSTTARRSSKHLILRTREEDVTEVLNIVVTILTTVFGLPTNKSRLKSQNTASSGSSSRSRLSREQHVAEHPEDFLKGLFFRRQHQHRNSHLSTSSPLTFERDRKNSSSRRSVGRGVVKRSSTLPPEIFFDDTLHPHGAPSISIASTHAKEPTDDSIFEAASLASSRRPLLNTNPNPNYANPNYSPASTIRSRPLAPPRVQTDPTPLTSPALGLSGFTPSSATGISASISTTQQSPSNAGTPSTLTGFFSGGHTHGIQSQVQGLPSHGHNILAKALVLSGLENIRLPSQRALMQVLSDHRLVLEGERAFDPHTLPPMHVGTEPSGEVWNLPDDFICVYVCPLDPSERPPILDGLLDKFSMSVDVNISPAVHQTYTAYRAAHAPIPLSPSFHSPSPRSPPTPLKPLTPISDPVLAARASIFRPASAGPPASKTPIIPPSEIARLRALTKSPPSGIASPAHDDNNTTPMVPENNAFNDNVMVRAYTSIHPSLHMYLADLFSATRHHPELDGTLLGLRASRDAEDLVRAFRVIGGNTLGTELISTIASMPNYEDTQTETTSSRNHTISKGDSDSLGWGSNDKPEEHVLMDMHPYPPPHSSDVNPGVRVLAPESQGDGTPNIPPLDLDMPIPDVLQPPPPPEIWDVSEVDIARVFPRVVSHRLRVRDGPEDEILGSLMFPAVESAKTRVMMAAAATATEGDNKDAVVPRKSVKEILVEILAEV